MIHTWDLRTRKCVSRFVDEGTIRGISLASSPGQRLLAAGSDAGFVNIYNHKAAIEVSSPRKPSLQPFQQSDCVWKTHVELFDINCSVAS